MVKHKKEDYRLFATIHAGKVKVEKIACKVYLPE
jgi:hypothetical protein